MEQLTYNNYNLHNNQKYAIQQSINNDFETGIHYHATGTGKSWTAMMILLEYHIRYKKNNIFWICERKDILQQQFNSNELKNRNFTKILKSFNVLDFTNYKLENWYNSINSSIFWNKPFLCIINRAFLTSQNKYKKIKLPIHLVIHDECHSVENKTTNDFYKWLLEINNKTSKIIGFSATPEMIFPFENV